MNAKESISWQMSNTIDIIREIQAREKAWKSEEPIYFRPQKECINFTLYNSAGRMLTNFATSNKELKNIPTFRHFVFASPETYELTRMLCDRLRLRTFKKSIPLSSQSIINRLITYL